VLAEAAADRAWVQCRPADGGVVSGRWSPVVVDTVRVRGVVARVRLVSGAVEFLGLVVGNHGRPWGYA